jgi:hypothetical protein
VVLRWRAACRLYSMMGMRDAIHLEISPGGGVIRLLIGLEKMSLSAASTSGSYL